MDLKYKDYNYLTFTLLLPFIALLAILYLLGYGGFHNKMFLVIIIILSIILLFTFIMSLLYTMDDIINNQDDSLDKSLKLSLLITFSIFYLPVHYIIHYLNKYKLVIIIILLIQGLSLYLVSHNFNTYLADKISRREVSKIVIRDSKDYYFDNDTFKINLSYDYICEDLGEYVLACSNKKDNSFIGVYSYLFSNYKKVELEDIFLFHLNQSINYIEDENYEYEEDFKEGINIINYDEMQVLISSVDIDTNDDEKFDNRLILIYENDLNEDNINNYKEIINKIKVNENLS